jgi:predicted  nucleic acid-binding Zn-ribbon protein
MRVMFDWECEHCGLTFERAEKPSISIVTCPKCEHDSFKIFPQKAPNFDLTYDPKKDMVDWDGNQTQYYRAYNEAKDRGENVRLPEDGE